MKLFILCSFVFIFSATAFAGFWDSIDKASEKMENINDKQEKLDRLNEAKEKQVQKQRDKKAQKEIKESGRKMMENQICMQYETMNSPAMVQAYKNDKKMKVRMDKQMEESIAVMNTEYERQFGKKYDYKTNCKNN